MAGVSSVREDVTSLEELLQCAICVESFTDPKKLECDHTFCEKCLKDIYKSGRHTHILCCPTCRRDTRVPAEGIAGLPSDFKANAMNDMVSRMKTRNHLHGCVCSPCQIHKCIIEAHWYCKICEVNYCKDCMKIHNKNTLLSNHEVREILPLQNAMSTGCQIHTDKNLRYYCQTCRAVACPLCVIESHAEHDLVEVGNLYEQNMDVMNNLRKAIDSKVKMQLSVKLSVDAIVDQVLQSHQHTEVAIKDTVAKMIASIRVQEADLLSNLKLKRDQHLQPLLMTLDNIEAYVAKAKCLNDDIDSVSQLHKLDVHKTLIQSLRKFAESGEPTCSSKQVLEANFLPSQQYPTVGTLLVKALTEAKYPTNKMAATQDAWDGKTVEIRGINTSTTDDAVLLFFESKRRSGGDAVSKFQRHAQKTSAYVTFAQPGVAEMIIAKSNLCLEGATLTVKKTMTRK